MLIKMDPLVWFDILDWLRQYRRRIVIKFNQLGNRQFSLIYQEWLHKRNRDVQMGELSIYSDYKQRAFLAIDDNQKGMKNIYFPLPEIPLPANIKGFKRITIHYLDSQVLGFLQKLAPLLTDVHLHIECSSDEHTDDTRSALLHLMPLLGVGEMEALTLDYEIIQLLPFINEHFSAKLFAAKWICIGFTYDFKVKYHSIIHYHSDIILQWLFTRREDGQPRAFVLNVITSRGQPRAFVLNVITSRDATGLALAIREHFLRSTTPVHFFVRLQVYSIYNLAAVQEESLENSGTSEQLIIRKMASQHDEDIVELLIVRCSATVDAPIWMEGMRQKSEQLANNRERKIQLRHMKFGKIDPDFEETADAVVDQEQPGPSTEQ